ncbi:MAG: sulfite exporter TauE/SafE family protein [Thiotrichales bacterium]|nr:sulfite exporter TauE/SafE family protein [Thiotrichales bacterium]MBT3614183.1 sulfite exporter TauE/SafE family protein [Thiotrichales bacterium]MBT3752001.1 sulfite exporter TauE/SafE family protein [Thiotrichales bacterium]MBT3837384.1 sulfite exporter TauE/SafE family protein [Thiotrichales bacterium]MBT4152669.1 sulfite exporter TauE/SafE family protein [Thiotrichales bacterium]
MDEFTTAEIVLSIAVIFFSYFVRGITGFGSALVAVPLLSLMFPITAVVPIVILLDYIGSLSHGVHHRKEIQWREIIPLIPFSLTGIVIALYTMKTVQPELLAIALAIFIISYAIYTLLAISPPQGSRIWSAPLGFLAGLVGTTFATGGPFVVIYLTMRKLGKLPFRGTIATIFMLDGSMRLIGYTISGFFSIDLLIISVVALPIMATGMWLGGQIHTGLSQQRFVQIISIVLLGSGSALLLKAW